MESQRASKLLVPLLAVGFMAPPREAVLEKCLSDFIAAAGRAVLEDPRCERAIPALGPSSWSHDLASLFRNQARDGIWGLQPRLGKVQLSPTEQLTNVGITPLLLFLITPLPFSGTDLLLCVQYGTKNL